MERLFENLGSLKLPKLPGVLSLDPTNGAYPWTPNCKGQHADVPWVMAYGHKTQSFMKNGGQQKCLDKALLNKSRNPKNLKK